MAEDPWSHSFHNAMLHRDPHRVLTSVLIGSTWRRQALPILHASLTFQNHRPWVLRVPSLETDGEMWVPGRSCPSISLPTFQVWWEDRDDVGQACIVIHCTTSGWCCYESNEDALRGESHPNPPQPFPCQSELTEQFHPTRHSTGGPSECLRPCTTHLMRPPLLCKLMPISYAMLIFQSYHDCSVGRGLVPSCAKRASRPTNGSQGLELLSFSK